MLVYYCIMVGSSSCIMMVGSSACILLYDGGFQYLYITIQW